MSFLSRILPGDNINDIFNPLLRNVGSFGTVHFVVSSREILTFRDLVRTTKSRFAQHNLLLQKPQLEFIGQDLTQITFKIQLLKDLCADVDYYADKLRWLCQKGSDHALVIGADVIGRFVVEEVRESGYVIDNHGNILVEELELTLKEYATNY